MMRPVMDMLATGRAWLPVTLMRTLAPVAANSPVGSPVVLSSPSSLALGM